MPTIMISKESHDIVKSLRRPIPEFRGRVVESYATAIDRITCAFMRVKEVSTPIPGKEREFAELFGAD